MQTLSSFLEQHSQDKTLNHIIEVIADSCKQIGDTLKDGALAGILGSAEAENVQGETQKKLDVIANDILKDALLAQSSVRALASEEEDSIVSGNADANLLVTFDPLDGSSNIDINSMVGTIFSILESNSGAAPSEQDFLQPGRQQRAAGYALYGPSTLLAITVGNGSHVFTLDQKRGEFILSESPLSISKDTKEFAINMSNQRFWAEGMQAYITDLLAGSEGPRGKNFNMRWVAAMVADVHRVLSRGGIFTYPWDKRDPDKPGKLRLMYEANPMAMLIEQAGGKACTDKIAILDVQPEKIHQRVPVILGSANEVDMCLNYHNNV